MSAVAAAAPENAVAAAPAAVAAASSEAAAEAVLAPPPPPQNLSTLLTQLGEFYSSYDATFQMYGKVIIKQLIYYLFKDFLKQTNEFSFWSKWIYAFLWE